MDEIIVVGAGLSGLATAYYLKKHGIDCKILEAQDRIGGRIHTIFGSNQTPMEMGATWFGQQHRELLYLLYALSLPYYEQHNDGISLFESFSFEAPQPYTLPEGASSAFRIKGGSSTLVETLAEAIGKENVILNTTITLVEDAGNYIKLLDTSGKYWNCKILIFALPPRLVVNKILFHPALPQALTSCMQHTQTWMSGSIKFSAEYVVPFWRNSGYSGNVFSQSGLAGEIYDHCNYEYNRFALKGFLNSSALNYTPKKSKQKVLQQLLRYFGAEALQPLSYHDKIWNDPFIANEKETFLPPHNRNGDPLYFNKYYNNKLYFSGSETSVHHGGYMDGAVASARRVVADLVSM